MINFDPRTKLILVLLISAAAIIVDKVILLAIILFITLLICKVLSINLLSASRRIGKLLVFFIILALIQSVFTSGGKVLLAIGNIKVLTTFGLIRGISIIFRMSIIICSALIIASSPTMKIIHGLIAMKLPYEIAFMVLIAIKFLPIFRDEFLNSVIAVQLSGVNIKKVPIREKISLYSYILMPTIAKALNRAKYISISMETRGFRAYENRTSYCKLKMKVTDYIFITSVILILFIITLFQLNVIS